MKINSFFLKTGIVAASGGALLSGLMAIAGPTYPTCSFNNNGAPTGRNEGACTQTFPATGNTAVVEWNFNSKCTCPGVDPNKKRKCTGGQNPSAQGAFSCY